MANLIEHHRNNVIGVLSYLDRLVVQGTLPSVAYPSGGSHRIRARNERLAAEERAKTEHI